VRVLLAAVLALALATPAARAQDSTPIVGGGSFNAAPLLEPGVTYRDSLLLGEYLYYALPLETGQRLHVRARIPDADAETWERGQDAFSIDLHTPQRERLGTSVDEDVAGNGNSGPAGLTRENAADLLRWDFYGPRAKPFLEAAGTENEYAGPGTWFVSLHSVRSNDRVSYTELPIELSVEADGEPLAEAPDPTPEPTPTPSATAAPEVGDGGGDGPGGIVLLGVGVAGLAVGLVASRALRRR
jgi:hypothetical protein